MKNTYKQRYPLHVTDMVSIFGLQFHLDGPESYDHYKVRVDKELSSLLHATTLLQNENPYSLAKYLDCSLRTAQRLSSSISLPDNFLRYLYFLQIR